MQIVPLPCIEVFFKSRKCHVIDALVPRDGNTYTLTIKHDEDHYSDVYIIVHPPESGIVPAMKSYTYRTNCSDLISVLSQKNTSSSVHKVRIVHHMCTPASHDPKTFTCSARLRKFLRRWAKPVDIKLEYSICREESKVFTPGRVDAC